MASYTREDLLLFRESNLPIPRLLFEYRLWKPRKDRIRDAIQWNRTPKPSNLLRFCHGLFTAGSLNARSIKNKSALICDIISEHDLDLFSICETWHEREDDLSVRSIRPPGYCSFDAPRSSSGLSSNKQRGGGLTLLFKDTFTGKKLDIGELPTTFEILCASLSSARSTVIAAVVYRTGPIEDLFFNELKCIFERLSLYSCPVIITGDLNFHLDDVNNRHSKILIEQLRSFGFDQYATGSTHREGHTLDVVIARSDLPPPTIDVRLPDEFSDHSLILVQLPFQRPSLQFVNVSTRSWKSFDEELFRRDLLDSRLCAGKDDLCQLDVDSLQELYDSTMSRLIEKHAPFRTVRRRHQPSTPWFDADCAAAKRKTRALERRYRNTGSLFDRSAWIAQQRSKQRLYSQKQNKYWENRITDSHGNPKKLWKNLTSVLRKEKVKPSRSEHISAENFSKAFRTKIEDVRSSTADAPYPQFTGICCPSSLDAFLTITDDDAVRLISKAANKNCELDPVPTWIVKKYADELSSFIAILFNKSLHAGQFPSTQKCAVITPVLKKSTLDQNDLWKLQANFKPHFYVETS